MTFDNIKYVYFLGIGGIGMSALARYFNAMGKTVMSWLRKEFRYTLRILLNQFL